MGQCKTFDELGFKEGDTVRCTKVHFNSCYSLGEVVELKRDRYGINGKTLRGVKNGIGAEWEIVVTHKFKVGDRVVITDKGYENHGAYSDNPKGIVGTVEVVREGKDDNKQEFKYEVTWDNGGWNTYYAEDLELNVERREVAPGLFAGDRVRKKDGTTFSNREKVITLADKEPMNTGSVWLNETDTHIHPEELVLDTPCQKETTIPITNTKTVPLSMFTEEVVETQTVETRKKKVKEVINGSLSNLAQISVRPNLRGNVKITIGAKFADGYYNNFSKGAVAELIKELQAVHDAM